MILYISFLRMATTDFDSQNMADSLKAQKLKLANSRKRFKELQELKKKRGDNKNLSENLEDTSSLPLLDSLGSSNHSSINEKIQENIPDSYSHPIDFDVMNQANEYQQPPVVFGDFSQKNYNRNSQNIDNENNSNSSAFSFFSSFPAQTSLETMVSDIVNSPTDSKPNEYVTSKYFNQENYSLFPQGAVDISREHNIDSKEDILSENNSKISHLAVHNTRTNSDSMFAENNSADLMDYLRVNSKEDVNENLAIKEITDSSNQAKAEVSHSSIESLRQLSNQMVQLMEPEYCTSSSITDLEKRNLELATHLEQEKIKSEQQKSLINELQMKVAQLADELEEKTETSSVQVIHEVSRLKEELQCHIQTIGMLVAEKTEISANLSQFEFCSKQKSAECEELQARLKASRSRVADLEREINNLKLEKDQSKTVAQDQSALLKKLQEESSKLKEEKEELTQDLLETREKLNNGSEENLRFQQQIRDLSNKLSLANIKIQQIAGGEQFEDHLEKVTQEKFELEKKVSELNQLLKTITKEHDDSSLQYQQYSQQQNAQLANLFSKLEQLQLENENLSKQEQNRIKHISELERQLQSLQTEQVAFATSKNGGDLEMTKELCIQLQIEKTTMEENYMKVSNEKEMLLKELEAKNVSLSHLEDLVEQLQGNQPDSVKLLATMESDKVAAAKAVQQNKELRQQMESMQEVFLKVNNDKVDLTEQLNKEKIHNKELLEKLQKTELHLQKLADAIEIKDHELFHLRESLSKFDKQMLQNEQLADRLRHYEARDNSSTSVQNELQEAKQTIVKLTNEINILKQYSNEHENANNLEQAWDNKLLKELLNNRLESNEINYIEKSENDLQEDESEDKSSNVQDKLDKEIAMEYLENKFKRTMQDIADLTDEKQRLEHLVMQLQGETETIGEYVALYQHQRMVLKQKTLEKDQQLKQLANDREQIKSKLEKLGELIGKLVVEKGVVPPELLQQYENINQEHTKPDEETNIDNNPVMQNVSEGSKTADEIAALLLEIKSSNLVQPNENIHHCPWCSGQLMTV